MNIMKKIIVGLSAITLSLVLIISSCTTPPIEAAQEAYDYNAIVPKVLGLNGPGNTIGHGLSEFPVEYSASYFRGGSTLEWSASGGTTILEVIDDGSFKGRKAKIVFPQVSEATTVTITVTETTMGGVKSEPFALEVDLSPYCPLDLDEFTGGYTVWDGDDSGSCTISRDPADPLFGLIISGPLSYWTGDGNGGSLKIKLDGCTNGVTFASQATGAIHATYGDITMTQNNEDGPNSFDPDDKSITITATHTVAAGSFGGWPVVFVKND
jgi:hypothetical protein